MVYNAMRILYIITKSEIGGAQVHLLEVVKYMHRRGYEISVVIGTKGWLTEELTATNVDYIVLPDLVREISPYKDFKAIWRMKKIIKAKSPDIIHCHSSKAGIVGRIAGWLENVPTIFTAHGWAFTEGVSLPRRLVYAVIEHIMLIITNRVFCVSQFDRQLAARWFLHGYKKIITIHNGVTEYDMCEVRSTSHTVVKNYSYKQVHLVMVARFSHPKDILSLIKAVQQVNQNYAANFVVSFVGDGPLEAECWEYVQRHDLASMVNFLGKRTDVGDILKQNDIFCLISNYEGLPISIIEAMRAGMPIIASDVGGVNELVQDEVNGFLIPRGNISELVDKLKYILHHKELIKSMGEASRKMYEEEYTADRMNQKILSVYNEVIALHAK